MKSFKSSYGQSTIRLGLNKKYNSINKKGISKE
jgi:hypothetical protein